jgi:hypothetical protein
MFSTHVYKIIILPNLEIFLFCQHNSTGGGNLELRQTIQLVAKKRELSIDTFLEFFHIG